MAEYDRTAHFNYLWSVALGFGAVTLLPLFAFLIVGRDVAPKLSDSISFNQKATWLRGTKTCDVLIVGSSMALNNIDGVQLRRSFPGLSVVNAGSWGLTAKESKRVLDAMAPVCAPRFVIFPLTHVDLVAEPNSAKQIDWSWFGKYLTGADWPLDWVQGVDPAYYLRTYQSLKSKPYSTSRFYTSLVFDSAGSVLLSDSNFAIDENRWNAYLRDSLRPLAGDQIGALYGLVGETVERRAVPIIIRMPMTTAAEAAFAKNGSSALWNAIELGVVERDGLFVDATRLQLPDQRFVDYFHLDGKGASAVTGLAIQDLVKTASFTGFVADPRNPTSEAAD